MDQGRHLGRFPTMGTPRGHGEDWTGETKGVSPPTLYTVPPLDGSTDMDDGRCQPPDPDDGKMGPWVPTAHPPDSCHTVRRPGVTGGREEVDGIRHTTLLVYVTTGRPKCTLCVFPWTLVPGVVHGTYLFRGRVESDGLGVRNFSLQGTLLQSSTGRRLWTTVECRPLTPTTG